MDGSPAPRWAPVYVCGRLRRKNPAIHPPTKHLGHYTTPSARLPGISSVLSRPVHHCTRGGVRVTSRDPEPAGDGRMSAARRPKPGCGRPAGHLSPGLQETAACRQHADRGRGAGGRPAICPRATMTRTTAHSRRSFPPSLPAIPSRAG